MDYDCHVHIGVFKNRTKTFYFSPKIVLSDLKCVGIKEAVLMSTTQNSGINSFSEVLQEFTEVEKSQVKVHPGLWCLPEMISNFDYYVNSYKWEILKIHPYSQNWKNSELEFVFRYASKSSLPIIIHTGFFRNDFCYRFEKFIKKYQDVKTILAHGHPAEEAKYMILKYENCYLDTAFMNPSELNEILDKNTRNKILYGSDYPVQYAHPDTKKLLSYIDKNKLLLDFFNSNLSLDFFFKK